MYVCIYIYISLILNAGHCWEYTTRGVKSVFGIRSVFFVKTTWVHVCLWHVVGVEKVISSGPWACIR